VKGVVSASDLSRLLGTVTIIDVRWDIAGDADRAAFRDGHISGAAFVDLDAELAGSPGAGGRHPLPSPEAFTGSMRRAGVSGGRGVVVYDAETSTAAARAWWLLRYFGQAEVAVLDGGLAAWSAAGLPLESGVADIEPGDFVARSGGMPVIDAGGAGEMAASGVLIDARTPERFCGDREPIDPVAGHIPGAVNRPSARNLDSSGRFREPDVLRREFEQLGVREGTDVGAYCGSGVTAAHEVLALELAGYRAALYVGSWSEWIVDPSRPVATGT
jgi:thiosulfate/3-mercaptopyruvate sulfurtransferase